MYKLQLKAQAKTPSFNDTCISGPDYLNCLDSILTRWRSAAKTAHSNISRCYHRISTSLLCRLWLKPVLGTDTAWEEYCVTKVSFGDILGGCVSTCAIWDTSERFMSEEARSNLAQNVYMDDKAVKRLKKLQDHCVHFKRHKKQVVLHT